jgi:hypothetical protein
MCALGRLQGALAIRLTLTHGNGAADFTPAVHPSECTGDTSETFDQARSEFEAAWAVFLSKRTAADFQAWRDQQAWTAEKYRRFDRGERMPPDWKPQRPFWLHHG